MRQIAAPRLLASHSRFRYERRMFRGSTRIALVVVAALSACRTTTSSAPSATDADTQTASNPSSTIPKARTRERNRDPHRTETQVLPAALDFAKAGLRATLAWPESTRIEAEKFYDLVVQFDAPLPQDQALKVLASMPEMPHSKVNEFIIDDDAENPAIKRVTVQCAMVGSWTFRFMIVSGEDIIDESEFVWTVSPHA